ncbi:MAG: class I SAM-dependent methyltransferase [Solirubrobacteraceae bacterium]|nr:class I SAM-dependent methyltransferase [Solirubrobacteraceae bacterium]
MIAIPYVIAAKRSDRPLAAHYAKQYAAEDLWNRILHRDGHLPPRRMWFVGGGDFEQIGRRYHDHLVNYAGLRPDSRVLDVGCGIGRMAIPLTTALGSDGSYDGFDVVDEGIRWCRRNITTKHPNFRFTTIEAQNGVYRPRGRVDAHSLRFPYEDASFDIVLLASVFTHMQEAAVAHYLHEIRRVLRPAGRAFVTVFLLDNVSRLRMATNRAEVIFDVPMGRHAMTAVAHQPEWAVGLDAAWFYEATAVAGLALDGEVKPGLWRGETSAVDYQDVVVLQCNAR